MRVKVEDQLTTVLSVRITRSERAAIRELAAYHKKTDSQLLREIVVQLVRAYEDTKSQASMGVSGEELAKRITRLSMTQLLRSVSPDDLRQLAARLAETANQLAGIFEKPPK